MKIIEKLSFFKYALDTLIVNQWFDDDPKGRCPNDRKMK